MTPADIVVALEPFGQVEPERDAPTRGHRALGLPLARRLAELCTAARLDIVSEKGRGTTVIVTLPPTRIDRSGAPAAAATVIASRVWSCRGGHTLQSFSRMPGLPALG